MPRALRLLLLLGVAAALSSTTVRAQSLDSLRDKLRNARGNAQTRITLLSQIASLRDPRPEDVVEALAMGMDDMDHEVGVHAVSLLAKASARASAIRVFEERIAAQRHTLLEVLYEDKVGSPLFERVDIQIRDLAARSVLHSLSNDRQASEEAAKQHKLLLRIQKLREAIVRELCASKLPGDLPCQLKLLEDAAWHEDRLTLCKTLLTEKSEQRLAAVSASMTRLGKGIEAQMKYLKKIPKLRMGKRPKGVSKKAWRQRRERRIAALIAKTQKTVDRLTTLGKGLSDELHKFALKHKLSAPPKKTLKSSRWATWARTARRKLAKDGWSRRHGRQCSRHVEDCSSCFGNRRRIIDSPRLHRRSFERSAECLVLCLP